jgi:hypothetical protein
MARKITVAELLVSLGVESDAAVKAADNFSKSIDKAEKKSVKLGAGAKKLAKGIALVGAAAATAALGVFKLVDSVTKAGDEIGKGAGRAGLSTKAYQELGFAAERSGATVEDLSRAARNQARFLDDATKNAVTPFTIALADVGLTVDEINAEGNFEKRFALIADALSQVDDESQKVGLAMKLVGEEAGPRLLNLLNEGSGGIESLREEAQRLGLVMSEDAVRASEAFQDSVTNLKGALQGAIQTVGVRLIPVVEKVIKRFTAWTVANRKMISQRLESFFERVFVAVERLLPAFQRFGEFILLAFENFDKLIAIMAGAATARAFAAVGAGFKTMGIAAGAAFGPIGQITGALAALIPVAIEAGNALGDVMGADGTNVSRKRESAVAASAKTNRASAKLLALEKRRRDLNTSGERLLPFELRQLDENIKAQRGRLEASRAEDAARKQKAQDDLDRDFPLIDDDDDEKPRTFIPRARPTTAPKGKKEKKPVSSITTVSDLLAAAGTGGIASLAAATPNANEIEPTVAVTILNLNLKTDVSNSFTGISDDVVVPKLTGAVTSAIQGIISQAGQQLAGNVKA